MPSLHCPSLKHIQVDLWGRTLDQGPVGLERCPYFALLVTVNQLCRQQFVACALD